MIAFWRKKEQKPVELDRMAYNLGYESGRKSVIDELMQRQLDANMRKAAPQRASGPLKVFNAGLIERDERTQVPMIFHMN